MAMSGSYPSGYFSRESCLERLPPEERRQVQAEIEKGVKPALSVSKVRKVLQGLDFETIGRKVLDIPDYKLKELINGTTSDEKREEILIDYWLLYHPLISWRLLIARLDNMGRHDRADRIRHLAEALTDFNLNQINVLTILNMTDQDMRTVEFCLCTPDDVDEMIWQYSINDEDRRNQLIEYWLEISPYASWQWLSGRLNWKEQDGALKASKKYVQRMPESTLTLNSLTSLLEEVKNLNEVTLWLHIPFTKQVQMRAQSIVLQKQAYWKYLLTQHPCPSWHLIAHALYRAGEHRVLEQLYSRYIPPDGSLQILDHPHDQCIHYGDEVSLGVTAQWRGILTYQWFKDGEPLTANSGFNFFGISSPSLRINSFLPENIGSYKCKINNSAGSEIKSRPANLSLGGHVLNSAELEALSSLFSDQVKSDLKRRGLYLDVAKNEVNDITIEQVRYMLGLEGHTYIASKLEEELQASVARNEFFRNSLREGISVALRYLKFLFLGPPRAGKTTFLRRLIGEILNVNLDQQEPSTPVAELHSAMIIVDPERDQLSYQGAVITDSRWFSLKETEDKSGLNSLDREALMIYRLIKQSETHKNDQSSTCRSGAEIIEETCESLRNEHVKPQQSESAQLYDEHPLDKEKKDLNAHLPPNQSAIKHPSTFSLIDHDVEKIFQEWDSLLSQRKYEHVEEIPKTQSILANMIDMGGQPPFLEMLPALTIGPAVYLVCFNLLNELDKRYPVKYVSQDGMEYSLQYSYSVMEVLFQALSSVACLSPREYKCSEEQHPLLSTMPPSSQCVMIVGTHKDMIQDDNIIKRKDKEIQSHFKKLLTCSILDEQPYHRFLSTCKGQLVVCVDNTAGENEIVKHRNLIKTVIDEKFHDGSRFPIPASWLLFSTFLRKMNKDVLTIEQCQQIAQKLYIPPNHTKHVLWYLHHHIGILMYYKKEDVGEDIVICQPKALFMSVSELILNAFLSKDDRIKTQFWQRGLLHLRDINDVTCNRKRKSNLTKEQLISILQHLSVLIEVRNNSNIFFIPAVLKAASDDKFQEFYNEHSDVAPLMIQFDSVFVPLGCFSSLIAKLVNASKTNTWNLVENTEMFKNLVTFKIEGSYSVTLVGRLKRYEIHLSVDSYSKYRPVQYVAQEVLATICYMLDSVLEQLRKHYVSSPDLTMYRIGFICNYSGCEQHVNISERHLMLFDRGVHTVSTSRLITCQLQDASVELVDPIYLNWCGEVEEIKKQIPDYAPGIQDPELERDPQLSKKPSMRELQVLKYRHTNGQYQKVMIIERASHKWRQIGDLISNNPAKDVCLEQQFHNHPQLCLRQLFIDCFITNKPAGGYTQDWAGIIEILKDVMEEQLAKEVVVAVLGSQDL